MRLLSTCFRLVRSLAFDLCHLLSTCATCFRLALTCVCAFSALTQTAVPHAYVQANCSSARLRSSAVPQTELLIVPGSASAPATQSTPSTPRAASFSTRLKKWRVRLLLPLFESSALFVMLTHLSEDLSVLCPLVHFALLSASACVAASSPLTNL